VIEKEKLGGKELQDVIVSTCTLCAAGCPLEFSTQDEFSIKQSFSLECDAPKYLFANQQHANGNLAAFEDVVASLRKSRAIRFTSKISNEDVMVLKAIKEELGIKLFNEDARLYGSFVDTFNSVVGSKYKKDVLAKVLEAESIVVLGSRVSSDNPALRYAFEHAVKENATQLIYMHPIEDASLSGAVTEFMKYEPGTEEGVLALLVNEILQSSTVLPDEVRNYLDELDIGYLEAESNLGDDELSNMSTLVSKSDRKILVLGADVFAHKRAVNIAKLAATIEKYSDFSVLIVPNEVNSVGISKLASLDIDDGSDAFVMPNVFQIPSSVVTMDYKIKSVQFLRKSSTYTFIDIAEALGVEISKINVDIEKFLEDAYVSIDTYALEDVDDLPEFNGTVIYHSNAITEMATLAKDASMLQSELCLRGSAQFALAAKIADGDSVDVVVNGEKVRRIFKLDKELKGTIALNPTHDVYANSGSYKFLKSKIVRVS